MKLCEQRCNGGIALQILLSRSSPHKHAGIGDAAGHDDYNSVLQNGSERIVAEKGAMLDESSKAAAEGPHGRTHGWLLKRRHASSCKVEVLNFQLLV